MKCRGAARCVCVDVKKDLGGRRKGFEVKPRRDKALKEWEKLIDLSESYRKSAMHRKQKINHPNHPTKTHCFFSSAALTSEPLQLCSTKKKTWGKPHWQS
jgi:hypothetical protein